MEQIEAKDVSALNLTLGEHIGHAIISASRSLIYGLTSGRLAPITNDHNISRVTKPYYRKMVAISASYAFLIEIALARYGTAIKFQETLSGLLSDLLINLYGLSTTLKYFDDNPNRMARTDHQLLLHWIAQTQVHEAQQLLLQLTQKLPAWRLLKWLVLPRGVNQPRPSLKQQNELIQALINHDTFKQSLTHDVVDLPDNHPLSQLQQAYQLSLEAEPILKRIKHLESAAQIERLQADGTLDEQEAQLLQALLTAKAKVEAVDDHEYASEKYQ